MEDLPARRAHGRARMPTRRRRPSGWRDALRGLPRSDRMRTQAGEAHNAPDRADRSGERRGAGESLEPATVLGLVGAVAAPSRRARRLRRDTPPRRTPDRPSRAGGAGASSPPPPSRDRACAVTHACDRKPSWGCARPPAACAHMGIAVRSSVRSTAGVPGDAPMSGGRYVHRRVPALFTDSPRKAGHSSRRSSLAAPFAFGQETPQASRRAR